MVIGSSSQGRIIVLVDLQIFLLLFVLLLLDRRRTVNKLIIVLPVKLVSDLEGAHAPATSATSASSAATTVGSTLATSAAPTRWLLLDNFLLLVDFVFFGGHALKLLDLLLQLSSTVFLEESLFLFHERQAFVQVISSCWGSNAKHTKLLYDSEIDLELLLILNSSLSLLSFVFLASADLDHSSALTFLLGHRLLHLTGS